MDVSVIIVNYNTCSLTRDCLQSVFDQTKDLDFEVIVSDNGSKDGSVEMVKQEFPQVTLVENNENLGFGKANNAGFATATGKFLFLLNSDTILKNNAIKIFYDYMMKLAADDIACCGTLLQGSDGNITHSYGDFHTMTNTLIEWLLFSVKQRVGIPIKLLKYARPKDWYRDFVRVDYVTGADLFIRRKVADEFGLFDPDFFMYYEDAELCKRYADAGYKSIVIRGPQIIHLEGKSNRKTGLSKKEMMIESMLLYMKKCHSHSYYSFFRIIFKMGYCFGFLFTHIPKKEGFAHIRNVIMI